MFGASWLGGFGVRSAAAVVGRSAAVTFLLKKFFFYKAEIKFSILKPKRGALFEPTSAKIFLLMFFKVSVHAYARARQEQRSQAF